MTRLGARVVRVEPPGGDPMRPTATAWDTALRAGSESVVCDLPDDAAFAQALCARADVVLEGFRPGVAARLGVGPDDVPDTAVYCSITGFGDWTVATGSAPATTSTTSAGRASSRTRRPSFRPSRSPISRPARSAPSTQVLAALLERERTGRGARLVVSMTHRSHDLVAHRLGGEPVPRLLTGGLACYRIYATADGRHLTVGALEPKFFRRLCELVGRPDLAERQYDDDQDALADRARRDLRRPHARRLARALRRRGRLRRPGLDARGGGRASSARATAAARRSRSARTPRPGGAS